MHIFHFQWLYEPLTSHRPSLHRHSDCHHHQTQSDLHRCRSTGEKADTSCYDKQNIALTDFTVFESACCKPAPQACVGFLGFLTAASAQHSTSAAAKKSQLNSHASKNSVLRCYVLDCSRSRLHTATSEAHLHSNQAQTRTSRLPCLRVILLSDKTEVLELLMTSVKVLVCLPIAAMM